jgi:soluble lytic murein transglycosylase-like protein
MWAASGLTANDSNRAALSSYLDRALSEDDGFEDRFDAEVWLVDMQERLTLLTQVHQQATQLDLSPQLVLSIIEVESGFDRYAVSLAGAQGLMQVMPFWKEEIGRPDDNLIHPDTNLRYGCHILRYYLDREAQHLSRALAAYNGSSGSSRYPETVRAVWHARWRNGPLDW